MPRCLLPHCTEPSKVWNAGLQATKDPAAKTSPYRMKASMDDTSLAWCVDAMVKSMADTDIGLFLSGRNKNIYSEILREFRAIKPRLKCLERTLEPDEDSPKIQFNSNTRTCTCTHACARMHTHTHSIPHT